MNNNNNIYQDNNEKKHNIIHNSYYYLDIINNKYKNSKSSRLNNHSTININYDDKFNLNEHYSPIKHKYKVNKNKNYCYYQKIQTTIDKQINNNKHNHHKRLVINNSDNFQKTQKTHPRSSICWLRDPAEPEARRQDLTPRLPGLPASSHPAKLRSQARTREPER